MNHADTYLAASSLYLEPSHRLQISRQAADDYIERQRERAENLADDRTQQIRRSMNTLLPNVSAMELMALLSQITHLIDNCCNAHSTVFQMAAERVTDAHTVLENDVDDMWRNVEPGDFSEAE